MTQLWYILSDSFCYPHISRIDKILAKFCPKFLDLYASVYGNFFNRFLITNFFLLCMREKSTFSYISFAVAYVQREFCSLKKNVNAQFDEREEHCRNEKVSNFSVQHIIITIRSRINDLSLSDIFNSVTITGCIAFQLSYAYRMNIG